MTHRSIDNHVINAVGGGGNSTNQQLQSTLILDAEDEKEEMGKRNKHNRLL